VAGHGELLPRPVVGLYSLAVLHRDKGCKKTACHDYVDTVSIFPCNEDTWFESNAIGEYSINQALENCFFQDDISNIINLRTDLYKTFEDVKFVIVPKYGAWFVHFMDFTYELGSYFPTLWSTLIAVSRYSFF
jgi:hypothetical protein